MEDSSPRKPSARGELTRQRILDAAAKSFAQKGYEGATLRDIAAEVGISNPSLYNHFDGKQSLYEAVLERSIRPILRILDESFEPGRDPGSVARDIIEVTMGTFSQRPDVARLIQHEVLSGGKHLPPMLSKYVGSAFAAGGQLAQQRIAETGFEDADVPHLLLTMMQAVLGYFAMGPLMEEWSGQDLTTGSALSRQTRLLIELSERLFSPTHTNPPPQGR